MIRIFRAMVRGHVQMVGFRYFVVERARELGLTGWVRNGDDGQTVMCWPRAWRQPFDSLSKHCGPGRGEPASIASTSAGATQSEALRRSRAARKPRA